MKSFPFRYSHFNVTFSGSERRRTAQNMVPFGGSIFATNPQRPPPMKPPGPLAPPLLPPPPSTPKGPVDHLHENIRMIDEAVQKMRTPPSSMDSNHKIRTVLSDPSLKKTFREHAIERVLGAGSYSVALLMDDGTVMKVGNPHGTGTGYIDKYDDLFSGKATKYDPMIYDVGESHVTMKGMMPFTQYLKELSKPAPGRPDAFENSMLTQAMRNLVNAYYIGIKAFARLAQMMNPGVITNKNMMEYFSPEERKEDIELIFDGLDQDANDLIIYRYHSRPPREVYEGLISTLAPKFRGFFKRFNTRLRRVLISNFKRGHWDMHVGNLGVLAYPKTFDAPTSARTESGRLKMYNEPPDIVFFDF